MTVPFVKQSEPEGVEVLLFGRNWRRKTGGSESIAVPKGPDEFR